MSPPTGLSDATGTQRDAEGRATSFFGTREFRLFRIAFFLIQLLMLLKLYYFREVCVRADLPAGVASSFLLLHAALSLTLMVTGRFASLYYVNYVFAVLLPGVVVVPCETEMIATSVAFLLVVYDIRERLLRRRGLTPNLITANLFFVCFVVGLTYVDAGVSKLLDPMWMDGSAIWSLLSLPFSSYWDLSFLLEFEFLLLLMSYGSLACELLFIFLVWFRPLRLPLLIVSAGLQVGIALTFPVQLFALITLAPLLLLLGTLRSDATVSKRTAAWLVLGLLCVQSVFAIEYVRSPPSFVAGVDERLRPLKRRVISRLTGVKQHPLMAQVRFQEYRTLVAIAQQGPDGELRFLPIVDERGQSHWLYSGRIWNFWHMYYMGRNATPGNVEVAVRTMMRHFVARGIAGEGRYQILVKRIEFTTAWEEARRAAAIAVPWVELGEIEVTEEGVQVLVSEQDFAAHFPDAGG